MSTRRRVRWQVVAAGLVAVAAGCASFGRGYWIADDAPSGREFHRFVLLPMNFDNAPVPALAPGAEYLGERIPGFLEAQGYEVVQPRMSTTLALWKEVTDGVGGIAGERGGLDEERYETALSELVRRTLDATPADGVVSCAVVPREARYVGKNLRWDGAMRPASVDMGDSNMPYLRMHGTDIGVSLRTRVFDGEGRHIFERYVGIEPMRRYFVEDRQIQMEDRKDIFRDEALVDAGISLSFQPWLGLPAVAE